MIDYKFKSEVLKTDLCKLVQEVDRNDFLLARDGIVVNKQNDEKYFDILLDYDYKWVREARKINTATYKRKDRLFKRIESYLLSGKCIFATLTFTNEVLDSTSCETRRKYVSRFLKSISSKYVANIDYGSNTEREHYHAVILVDFVRENWDYGHTWYEHVHTGNGIAKYIAKLCNHAIKESTKRACYIYSRNT